MNKNLMDIINSFDFNSEINEQEKTNEQQVETVQDLKIENDVTIDLDADKAFVLNDLNSIENEKQPHLDNLNLLDIEKSENSVFQKEDIIIINEGKTQSEQKEIVIEQKLEIAEQPNWSNFDDDDDQYSKSFKIKIFGIGGAGCNVIDVLNRKFDSIKENANLYALNTDVNALKRIKSVRNRFLLGKEKLKGYGSGGDPEVGRQAAIADKEAIKKELANTNLLFIVAGMGKGTGSGASPEIAKIAKELGILTIGIINMPSLACEGNIVYKNALESLNTFKENCDSITTISNERIINKYNEKNISFHDAYALANQEVGNVIVRILNLIYQPTIMNIDFADIKNFFKNNKYFYVNGIFFDQPYDVIEFKESIQKQIAQSNSDISLTNAHQILVNLYISRTIPSTIVGDIRKVFGEISGNKSISLISGIDYIENSGKDVVEGSFIISGSWMNAFSNVDKILKKEQINKTSKIFLDKDNEYIDKKNNFDELD